MTSFFARLARVPLRTWLALLALTGLVAVRQWVADEAWKPALAKLFNFSLLVGLLVYFLRGTVVAYLAGRRETIRKDLVQASDLKATAEQQLAAVRTKLSLLPAEIAELERRGQEELAREQVRMKEATAHARDLLIDRARRDIDLRLRVARRTLTEHTADLAVRLARTRLEQTITPDDQARLIDRYAREVRP